MHESNTPNQEISSAQEDLFIMAIENLRPLMGQPQLDVENFDNPVDENNPSGSTIFVATEASFDLNDKKISVYIDESTGVKEPEGGEPAGTKRFTLMVTEPHGHEGNKKIFILKKYETSDHSGPSYEESIFYVDTKTGESHKMRTPQQLATSEDLKLLDNGEIDINELSRRGVDRLIDKQEFEEKIGVFSTRFTQERFSDVMAILDQLNETNLTRN